IVSEWNWFHFQILTNERWSIFLYELSNRPIQIGKFCSFAQFNIGWNDHVPPVIKVCTTEITKGVGRNKKLVIVVLIQSCYGVLRNRLENTRQFELSVFP